MKNLKTIIIVVLGIGLIFSLLDSCSNRRKNEELSFQLRVADSVKNKLGQTVYSQDVQITQKDEELKKYSDSVFNLGKKHARQIKEVHAYYASRTKVEMDSVLVPYEVKVKDKKWEDSIAQACKVVIDYYKDSTVKIGSKANDSSRFYKVELTVQKEGVLLNNIQFIDSQHIRIVTIKGGLLKRNYEGKFKFHVKKRMKVEVLHTNPYFVNEGINAIFVEEKKKNHFLKGLLLGGGAVLITTLIL